MSYEKQMMSEQLQEIAHYLESRYYQSLHELDSFASCLNSSAQLCHDIGTSDIQKEFPHSLLHALNELTERTKAIQSDLIRYCEYLKHCGIPMTPATPDFLNPFESINLR